MIPSNLKVQLTVEWALRGKIHLVDEILERVEAKLKSDSKLDITAVMGTLINQIKSYPITLQGDNVCKINLPTHLTLDESIAVEHKLGAVVPRYVNWINSLIAS